VFQLLHIQRFSIHNSIMPHLRLIGVHFKFFVIESVDGVPLLATDHGKIVDGIITTGEVLRMTNFESVRCFWDKRT